MLNETQIQILTHFLNNKKLKYSEARPKGIANDLYNYHLQFLVSKDFLKKEADKYLGSREL